MQNSKKHVILSQTEKDGSQENQRSEKSVFIEETNDTHIVMVILDTKSQKCMRIALEKKDLPEWMFLKKND